MTPRRAEVWFRVVCGVLALEQLGLGVLGWWVRGFVPPPDSGQSQKALQVYGAVLMGLAAVFLVLHLWMAFARRSAWLWIAGLTTLSASIVCFPPGALLLFPWLRQDVKRYFGMT